MEQLPRTPTQALRSKQGAKVREYREFRNLTQLELAAAIGVTKQTVSMWETGVTSPRQAHQVLIARKLQCPWNILFGLDAEAVA